MGFLIKLPKGMTRLLGRISRRLKYNAPEIMVGGGIILGGAAIVHGCYATWKNKEKLSEDFKNVKKAKQELIDIQQKEGVTEEEVSSSKKKLVRYRLITSKDIGKTWGITGGLALASGYLSWKGRGVLRNRLTETTALAAMLSRKLEQYRAKTAEVVGPEKEAEIAYGTKNEQVVDEESGQVYEQALLKEEGITSPYARVVSEGLWDELESKWIWKNEEFIPDPIHMAAKISYIQRTQSDLATARGWMTWGEVAPLLGLAPDPSWFRTGWWATKPGERINIELGVLPGPHQIPFNRGFIDPKCPQNKCIVDPNVMGCIDEVMSHIWKYDRRFGRRRKHRVPSIDEMFGEEYSKKLKMTNN